MEKIQQRKTELKRAKSFSVFLVLFFLIFSFLSGFLTLRIAVFPFFGLMGVILWFFYDNEEERLKKSDSFDAYYLGYYRRYSITVNSIILLFGIVISMSDFISFFSIGAILWALPNLIYFVYLNDSKDDILDVE